jgi:hypothetical protein
MYNLSFCAQLLSGATPEERARCKLKPCTSWWNFASHHQPDVLSDLACTRQAMAVAGMDKGEINAVF